MDVLKSKLAGYAHIIWDWNGTILADMEQIWRATLKILNRYQLPHISLEDYRKDFCLPLPTYYTKLGFDLGSVSYQEIAHAFQEEYSRTFMEAQLFEGTIELLTELGTQGKTNSLLSASPQTFLDHNVNYYGIRHLFSHVYGVPNRLAQGKGKRGIEMLEEIGLDPSKTKTILIGDTDHDLEVGQEMGVDVLLIADGHQNFERLSTLHHNVLETRYGTKCP